MVPLDNLASLILCTVRGFTWLAWTCGCVSLWGCCWELEQLNSVDRRPKSINRKLWKGAVLLTYDLQTSISSELPLMRSFVYNWNIHLKKVLFTRHLKVAVLVLKEIFYLQSSENSSVVDLRMDLSYFEILCEGSALRLGIWSICLSYSTRQHTAHALYSFYCMYACGFSTDDDKLLLICSTKEETHCSRPHRAFTAQRACQPTRVWLKGGQSQPPL